MYMKIVCTFCLVLMVLIFSACGNSNIPTQPQVEAKNPPLIAGTWADDKAVLELCGESDTLSLGLFLVQTKDKAYLSGRFTFHFSDGSVEGPFKGQVNDTGTINGEAGFADSKGNPLTFKIDLLLQDMKLVGKIEDPRTVTCDDGSSDKLTFEANFRALNVKVDDPFEPNNSRVEAKTIPVNFEGLLYLDKKDHDWFTFTLNESKIVTLTIDAGEGLIDPEFVLIDEKGQEVVNYNDLTKQEPAKLTLQKGTYFFHVYEDFFSDDETMYRLVMKDEIVVDNSYEPNNTLEQATLLTPGFSHDFYVSTSRINSDTNFRTGDSDTFTFVLDEQKIISLDLGEPNENLGYRLWRVGQTEYANPSDYTKPIELGLSAGVYYVTVYAQNDYAEAGFVYTVTFNTKDVPDKGYEPNNLKEQAVAIETNFQSNDLLLISQDEDWFTFEIASPSLLTVALRHSGRLVNPELYNNQMQQIDIFYTDVSGSTLNYFYGVQPGRYYLKYDYDDLFEDETEVYYSFGLSVSPLTDDNYEPNDSSATARPISLNFDENLFLANNDEDWFTFSLDKAATVKVECMCDSTGEFHFDLFDSSGNWLIPTTYPYHQLEPGTYYIEIFGYSRNGIGEAYHLNVSKPIQ